MDGANLLFDVTKKFLAGLDNIPFDERIEAQHLAGGNYQGGLAEYFAIVKTKKLAAKAAKDLSAAFVSALNAAVPKSITQGFRKFVQTIAAKGVKIVISTRADVETVRPAFAGLLGDDVVLFQETSSTYGSVKWDAWRRACAMNKLRNFSTIAVTGSGFGVKSALVAGMGSVAVTSPHVAYQDFGGADEVVSELNAAAAKTILEILRA
jgi:phosphoglycolate phosphatase-like HAD superfamily hydrolase